MVFGIPLLLLHSPGGRGGRLLPLLSPRLDQTELLVCGLALALCTQTQRFVMWCNVCSSVTNLKQNQAQSVCVESTHKAVPLVKFMYCNLSFALYYSKKFSLSLSLSLSLSPSLSLSLSLRHTLLNNACNFIPVHQQLSKD